MVISLSKFSQLLVTSSSILKDGTYSSVAYAQSVLDKP